MDFEPTLSPRFVVYVRLYLLDRNVDPLALFDQLGLSAEQQEDDPPLPLSLASEMIEGAGKLVNDPFIGLNLARNYRYEAAGLIIMAVMASSNVEQGLRALSHYDRALDLAIETRMEVQDGRCIFSANLINPKNVAVRQLNEYLICFLVSMLFQATRKKVPVLQASFTHRAPDNPRALEKHFDAPVLFDKAENQLIFDSTYLSEAFISSNTLLYDVLTKSLRSYFYSHDEIDMLVESVCREIMRHSGSAPPSLEAIADSMAMSGRTLRRRLKDSGHSFQSVKNLAREKRAKFYLHNTNVSLAEIAFELGFSELSAFSRAFRGWTEESPQEYRERMRQLMHNLG